MLLWVACEPQGGSDVAGLCYVCHRQPLGYGHLDCHAQETERTMVYGMGNSLMDVVIQAEDEDLPALGLDKGIMHLVTEGEQAQIPDHLPERPRTYLPGGSAPNTLRVLVGLRPPGL